MPFLKYIFVCLALGNIFFSEPVTAQRRCGVPEFNLKLKAQNISWEHEEDFEEWLSRRKQDGIPYRKHTGPYKIPVVVHIIHNGEPIGEGANISDAQVFSQIKVLNDDFQRKNADTLSTPAEFQDEAAGMDIEFVLAKRNPAGFATSGIVRVDGGRSSWTSGDDNEIKAHSYWPAEDYLNIWVCNITDFLGYAQFPISDLPGLENSPENRLTDGLVISHLCFGSIEDGNFNLDPQYDRGRTATHELSHFFGLRHIWGDDSGCRGTDYVDDTPNQESNSNGCPVHPKKTCDPQVVKMFQNFQDYTDDRCMNLFTQGQVDRMEIVLENSPRRASLLTSPALLPPDKVRNDAQIARIISPLPAQCNTEIYPSIEVFNNGKNPITGVSIQMMINGIPEEAKDIAVTLDPETSTVVTFDTKQTTAGYSALSFEVLSTNDTIDGDNTNDTRQINLLVKNEMDVLPLRQTFEDHLGKWIVTNAENGMLWDTITTDQGISLYFNSFRNFKTNDEAWLISPELNLANAKEPSLMFDLAYKKQDLSDEMKILVSTNCGLTYVPLDYELPGTDPAGTNWKPSTEDDWFVDEYVSLSQFSGEENVRVAFIAINRSGNNIYLDNIEFYTNHDPRKASIESSYNLFGYRSTDLKAEDLKIGFNLASIQDVTVDFLDMKGQSISKTLFTGVLNQVYDLPGAEKLKPGLYVVRVRIGKEFHSSKVVIRE